ncbi:MAG: class I SAM-dependent methyltransferase [Dehalococcoidia bacterium]|nr:class I SAM-dependent methyltransferase [Dehalococcoidia bacterium]
MGDSPRLYADLASWFHLLTAPDEYIEEAAYNAERIAEAAVGPVRTVLELGSGGGNSASHLKRRFEMTLSDVSPEMLAVSRRINPEVEHVQGDMRSLRLAGRQFDGVFVHDAVSYLTSEGDVGAMAETAAFHCRAGGAVLVVPDHVRERFSPPYTEHGGADGPDGRGLRYLMWATDQDPEDSVYVADFVYLLREADGSLRVEQDRHVLGLFPEAAWMGALRDAGFEPTVHADPWGTRVFSGTKRGG